MIFSVLALLSIIVPGGEPTVHPLQPVSTSQVVVEDDFWSPKLKVWREVTIHDCFAKFEKDGALANFDKIRDGVGGEHGGPPWYDGLTYEMIRASADFLAAQPDAALEAQFDGYILANHMCEVIGPPPRKNVNPLEFERGAQSRWAWHGCPCCPPMFLKVMSALPSYVYATDAQGVYVNLFGGGRVNLDLGDREISLQQTTKYPWEGTVRIAVEPAQDAEFDLFIRIPAWCQGVTGEDDLYKSVGRPETGAFSAKVNGEQLTNLMLTRGYATLHCTWRRGDVVDVTMDMPVRRMKAHPQVAANAGPCQTQNDFFTSDAAKALYEKTRR